MKIEVTEWSRPDQFGDREYMGKHFYGLAQCERIVWQGGSLEYGPVHLDTVKDVQIVFS